MSNIHSVEGAYEQLAEVLNYLDEHGENVAADENAISGKSQVVFWDSHENGWLQILSS